MSGESGKPTPPRKPVKEPRPTRGRAFIANILMDSAGMSRDAAERTAAALLEAMAEEIKTTGRLNFRDFGTFTLRAAPAQRGINPRTGVEIKIEGDKTLKFEASESLKKRLLG